MGKRLEINPAWLVSLLNQWALHDMRSETGGLGYASGSGWMQGMKPSTPAARSDPTGYAARDFREVDAAMDSLRQTHKELWAAVSMYYKPWAVQSFRDEGYPFANSVYYARLHKGHAEIAWFMDKLKAAREASSAEVVVVFEETE